MRGVNCCYCLHFFLDNLGAVCYDISHPKIKTFFTGFLKIVIFKWKNEKQNCFTAVENRGFSKRSVMEMQGFPQKRRLLWIQNGELKKNRKFLKKSVDKWDCAWYYKQALERAGRKRPANDDSAKALCKLNNTKKDKKPWQLFEFEMYFSNSIWEAKFELI